MASSKCVTYRLGVAMLSAFFSTSALAQDPAVPAPRPDLGDLDLAQLLTLRVDTVFGASRYEQKLSRAPASVTIVTSDDIRRFGYRTLADILRSVRGLYVTYDRNYSNLGIRGFNRPGDFDTRVLLLLDGHRLNDNLYSSALVGREGILDVDLIERVEIIRGPSSSIYGNSAFFGVINVVTKRGGALSGVEVAGSGGSLGTYEARGSYGSASSNGVEALASGTLFESSGQKHLYYPELDTPENGHGVANGLDGESARSAFGRLGYAGFTLTAAYSRRDKTVPTGSYGTVFGDGREKTRDEKLALDLSYERALPGGTHLMARAFYDMYSYRSDYPFDFNAPRPPRLVALTHDDNRGDEAGAEVQLTKALSGGHTLVVGAEYRQDVLLRQRNVEDLFNTVTEETGRERRNLGLYAQAEMALSSKFLLNAGLRYDYHDGFGSTLSPRLGLLYSPNEGTTLKALYGRAYRAPNAYELYLATPGYNKANPSLDPETIQTLELVLERRLGSGLTASTSAYFYDVDDLISQQRDQSDGLLVFRNADSVRATGLEFELDGAYPSGLSFRASYALERTEDERTGLVLTNSPRHLAKAAVGMPVFAPYVTAGLEAQYTSALKTLAGHETAGVVLFNATLSGRTPVRGFDWSVSAYDLFDTAYAYPGSTAHVQDVIPQDGRTIRAKLVYRF
jgi:outer membrane receptor for ferrienterochelin and colicins